MGTFQKNKVIGTPKEIINTKSTESTDEPTKNKELNPILLLIIGLVILIILFKLFSGSNNYPHPYYGSSPTI